MNDRPFFDTNVVLYAFRKGDFRNQVAETLIAGGGIISIQVLNEFVALARRKLNRSWTEVHRALEILQIFCPRPLPLDIETHQRALQICERFNYSIYDSLIVAAALKCGATTLYSEDMQDGQTIDGVTIRNPFTRRSPKEWGG